MLEIKAILWLVLMVIFVVIEIATMGLYTIWFAAGALAAFVATILGFSNMVQLWTFVIVAAVLLIFTRPIVNKLFEGKRLKKELDTVEGKTVVITEKVDNVNRTGKAVLNNVEWTVRAEEEHRIIDSGTEVTIVKVDGVKLIVK